MRFPPLSSVKGKMLAGLLIGGLAWILAALLYYGGLLESYELRTYDQLCRLKAGYSVTPGEVALIAVDQNSLEATRSQGINWPWPRQMYAPILQFCAASGAKAVVFDILFTEPSSYGVEDDQILADAVRANARAVLAIFLSRQEHSHPSWEKLLMERMAFRLKNSSGQTITPLSSSILPIQPLAESSHALGNVATLPDLDGIYRRIPIIFFYEENWIPSLGLAVFRDETLKEPAVLEENEIRLNGARLPLDRQKMFLLHYYSSDRDFPRYSAFNVIQSALALQEGKKPIYALELLRDKIVFVGYTAPGLFDLKPTPINSRAPGMSIHATLAANILHRDFRVRISSVLGLALALGLAAAVAVTVLVIPRLWLLALVIFAYSLTLLFLIVLSFWENIWVDGILLASSAGISFAMSSAFSYTTEGRQRRQIKDMFSRYMSDLLIQDLLKNPGKLRLGGEKRVLTVFFSDLAGFTTLSEKLAPDEVVSLLNQYLTAMTDIILASGGIIDKYEGDAIMAFWGAPVFQEDHAVRACLAALDNQARLVELRREFARRNLPQIFARIGINTGEMIIGNMGSSQRFDFTVIGDSVNLGSRLEGAGKEYGVSIIISQETYRQAAAQIEVRELDWLQVKGKELPVRIYELLSQKGALDGQKDNMRRNFAEGLRLYREKRWPEAIGWFERVLDETPEDGPSRTFIARCRYYEENPPEPEWKGVYRLTTK